VPSGRFTLANCLIAWSFSRRRQIHKADFVIRASYTGHAQRLAAVDRDCSCDSTAASLTNKALPGNLLGRIIRPIARATGLAAMNALGSGWSAAASSSASMMPAATGPADRVHTILSTLWHAPDSGERHSRLARGIKLIVARQQAGVAI
jgi:hypothetical protein